MQLKLALLIAVCSGQALAQPTEIRLNSRMITAGDLSPSAPAPQRIVAQIPAGRSAVKLTPFEQERLLRNSYPGAELDRRYKGDVLFVAGSKSSTGIGDGQCYATRHVIAQGQYIGESDVSAVPCDPKIQRVRLGFDRAVAMPFATTEIPALSFIGSLKLAPTKPLMSGSNLTLRTISGPVTIDRKVVTLQPGFAGQRIFVRTTDGNVFASRLEERSELEDAQ